MKPKYLGGLGAAAAMLLFAGGAAVAASPAIETAKSGCIVGERIDGYLGAVEGASLNAALKREIDEVNLGRKGAYAQLAADRGVTIEATAAIAAKQLIERAPTGHCVQNDAGRWVRVP